MVYDLVVMVLCPFTNICVRDYTMLIKTVKIFLLLKYKHSQLDFRTFINLLFVTITSIKHKLYCVQSISMNNKTLNVCIFK